jgi:hypothetical protein
MNFLERMMVMSRTTCVSPLFIVLTAALTAPLAHAACSAGGSSDDGWCVTDDKTHTDLEQFSNRFDVKPIPPNVMGGTDWSNSGGTSTGPADPTTPWVTSLGNSSQAGSTAVDLTQSCSAVAPAQYSLCVEIANTRNAYYQYMHTMYQNNQKRYQELNTLVQYRVKKINTQDFGALQANTNEILALQNLIALDRQQMESVDRGYRMQIQALTEQMTQQAKNMTSGTGGGSSGTNPLTSLIVTAATDAIQQGVLKAALNSNQDTLPAGAQPLFWKTSSTTPQQ